MPLRGPAPVRSRHSVPLARRGERLLAGQWWATLLVAGLLCFVTFHAKGGLSLEPMTTAELVLTLLAGAVAAAAVLLRARDRDLGAAPAWRGDGLWSVGLLFALAALTAISIVWSVAPAASWQDADRMFAYAAVFGATVAVVRVAPARWPAVLGGVTLAAVVVCGYALLTKVFPATLASSNTFARLEEPFGYWNAVGLMAAMGAVGCMWLGGRRAGHALLSALAYPAMGVLLVALALAYSRGALATLAIGVVAWLCVVPLRLRGAAVLLAGAVGAGAVAAYAFGTHALSSDNVALAERTSAGHRLGALLLAMVLALALIGIAVGFSTSRRPPSLLARRRAGTLLLALVAAAIVAFAGALAHSHRGFTGSISHAVTALTDPNAKTPPNTPGRLTAVASVRARYWKEALEVFSAHPVLGAGAMGYQTARLRYRKAPLTVAHAHGFLVQTLADLGLVGLLLVLVLFACWAAAAGRATHPLNRSWTPWRTWRGLLARERLRGGGEDGRRRGATAERPAWRALSGAARAYTPERVALLTMLCIVVCFGVHSLADWTWYVPGDACVALICAAWLAGRGPLGAGAGATSAAVANGLPRLPPARAARAERRPRSPRGLAGADRGGLVVAAAIVVAALLAAWSQWQPLRSEDARNTALEQLASNPRAALASARTALARDPLSPLAAVTLAEVQQANGLAAQARATLQKLVREQPSNPQAWLALGRYDLAHEPRGALAALQAAIFLNPESIAPELLTPEHSEREAIEIYNDYIQATRDAQAAAPAGPGRGVVFRNTGRETRSPGARSASAARLRAVRRAQARLRRIARERARSRSPLAAG
jgi:cytochrome c-type biogenesis protein CcmH/NrfG